MSLSPHALALVEQGHRWSAFYRGELANHLPMALGALDAMGADEAALRRFAARYSRQLEAMPACAPAMTGEAGDWLGRREAFPAWVAYFEARLPGGERVLSDWLARLMPGVASGAFHGLIRVAYALPTGSRRELAHALAYWAAAFDPLPSAALPLAGRESPGEILAFLAAHEAYGGRRRNGGLIAARTQAAAAEPAFAGIAARLSPSALSIDTLARAMLECYAASGNFTTLHGVTACHAFRALMPLLDDGRAALGHFWHALLAAHVGAGSPSASGEALGGDTTLGWEAILARAVRCEDEHDVKLVHTCWREWQSRGDDLYRRVAASRVSQAATNSGTA